MPWRASLVALVLLFNACTPFGAGGAGTDDERQAAAEPVSADRAATEPPLGEDAPPARQAPSANDADAGTAGGDADAGPPPAKDDCTLIDCLLH